MTVSNFDFEKALHIANASMALFQTFGDESNEGLGEVGGEVLYKIYENAHNTYQVMKLLIEDNATPEQLALARAGWSKGQVMVIRDWNYDTDEESDGCEDYRDVDPDYYH